MRGNDVHPFEQDRRTAEEAGRTYRRAVDRSMGLKRKARALVDDAFRSALR